MRAKKWERQKEASLANFALGEILVALRLPISILRVRAEAMGPSNKVRVDQKKGHLNHWEEGAILGVF